MQQSTQQPGQPGGPGSIRRAASAAPPVIRTRQEVPTVRVSRPSSMLRWLEAAQTYLLSEETLILVEILVVMAIGIFVFVAVLHPMETLMNDLGRAISNLGLTKLFK